MGRRIVEEREFRQPRTHEMQSLESKNEIGNPARFQIR